MDETKTQSEIPEWIQSALGPQQVGGRYLCGYWAQEYEVLAITVEKNEHGQHSWSIAVRWADGHKTEHCTAWDPRRDKVLAEPAVRQLAEQAC